MHARLYNVLFVCTGNSARSIRAEGFLNKLGAGRFRAFSAGSFPAGKVNPLAIERLEKEGIPPQGLRSKSWSEFAHADSFPLDFVITVCDKAAGEPCPARPGQPMTAHWGPFDPAAEPGSDGEKSLAFARAFAILERRIGLFVNLRPEGLERIARVFFAHLGGELMKRLHIHVSVADLNESIRFYGALFHAEPSVLKPDYAKWMLEDPRVNFAISNRSAKVGLDHLGIQAENGEELCELKERLDFAGAPIAEQLGTGCCYALSDKYWTLDPQGIPWESFHSLGEIPVFGEDANLEIQAEPDSACCATGISGKASRCCG